MMNSASIRAVSRVTTEPGDLIPVWPSNGHHVGTEGANGRTLLGHALSFTPEMDSKALRAWAQAAKYLAERDRAAESKLKDNLPLNDAWAQGARTAISFLDPLVRTESWPSIQRDNYCGARLMRERKSMSTQARMGMGAPDIDIGNASRAIAYQNWSL